MRLATEGYESSTKIQGNMWVLLLLQKCNLSEVAGDLQNEKLYTLTMTQSIVISTVDYSFDNFTMKHRRCFIIVEMNPAPNKAHPSRGCII
jgi:hypothetical protein